MALTGDEVARGARRLARDMFTDKTANLNLDDLKAAVQSIDAAMDTVISTIPAGMQDLTIKQGLVVNLPEPFKSTATAQEKALALMIWAMAEVGLLE